MLRKRLITKKLHRFGKTFPIVTITGARQVGKTTLLHELYGSDFDYVVFDPTIDIQNARAEPDLFLAHHKTPLILDEVQYAPELIAALKRKIDTNRAPGQYFLTGSQQWGVIQKLSESLAGRTVFLDLSGFALCEIAGISENQPWLETWLNDPENFSNHPSTLLNSVSTYEQIWRGWLPGAQTIPLETVSTFYQAYHRTYIERDIRLLADVGDWQLFGRFVQLTSALSAQEINYSHIGRELGNTPQTSRRWLELLKAAFQWFEIPPFSTNALKKVSNKPKGYLSDTGSICALQSISSPETLAGHPLWGHIFENAVVCELIKQAEAMSTKPNFYHWRAHSGAEVDLILEWNGRLYPIEIKGTSTPTKKHNQGIASFRANYSSFDIAPALVICNADKMYPLAENTFVMPWNYALKSQ